MANLHAYAAKRVIRGDGGVAIDQVIVVSGARIEWIGPAAAVAPTIPLSDFDDATILPGLIDGHVHTTFPADGSSYDEMLALSDAVLLDIADRNVSMHLLAGVTTMRDNGARGGLGLAVRERTAGRSIRPRVLVAGAPVTQTGGHMHWCSGTADGVDGVADRVRHLADVGVDHIKLIASGGGTKGTVPYEPAYSSRELEAAVQAAREAGLRTTAHCHPRTAIERAVEAGVDCIEHASFLVPSTGTLEHIGASWSGLQAEFDPSLAERIAQRGSFVSATLLGGYEMLLRLEQQNANGELGAEDRRRLAAAREHIQRKTSILRALIDFGLIDQLLVSTDAGPGETAFGRMHLALRAAVLAGMTPLQAIEAGTRVAAAALGLERTVGRLQPGMEADMLVVAGDAAADIRRLGDVRAVITKGRPVPATPAGSLAVN